MLKQHLRTELYARTALNGDPRFHPAYLMLFRMFADSEQYVALDSLSEQLRLFIPEVLTGG